MRASCAMVGHDFSLTALSSSTNDRLGLGTAGSYLVPGRDAETAESVVRAHGRHQEAGTQIKWLACGPAIRKRTRAETDSRTSYRWYQTNTNKAA
jgi:hypothetical protein